MDLTRLLDAVSTARADGVGIRDHRFYASAGRRLSLGVKDREAGSAHAPLSLADSAGVRYLLIWDDGRVSRGHLERGEAEEQPAVALAAARDAAYEDEDAAQVLGPAPMPTVDLHDARVAEAAGGEVDLLVERLAAVRRRIAAAGVRTWSGSFSFAEGHDRLVTSAGLDVGGRGTSAGWHVTLDGEIGDGYSARDLDSDEEFEARLTRLVETAEQLRRAAAPIAGGMHRVLLHPRVVEGYVLDTLLSNLDGSTVAHGQGQFRAEQFGSGEPLFREDLSLRLDPLQPMRSGSYRFTREGLPAARCSFIENGRLVRPVLDLKYARRLGLAPTPVPYASDALFLEGPPRLRFEQVLGGGEASALVLSVLGVHTQDPASGDFSLAAPQVLRLGAEGYAGKLKATISGNLFDLLRDAHLRLVAFAGEHTPGLLVECRFDPD